MTATFKPFRGASPENLRAVLDEDNDTTEPVLGAALLKNPRSGARKATYMFRPSAGAEAYEVQLQISADGKTGWVVDSARDQKDDLTCTADISPSLWYRAHLASVTSGESVEVSLTV